MSSAVLKSSRPTFGETYPNGEFKTAVFSVKSLEDIESEGRELYEACESQGYAEFVFLTADRLLAVITGKRWDILTVLAGAGEISIREVSRRVGRDVKAVHGDVIALIDNGIVDRGPGGGVIFPYENLHLDLSYSTAA